MMIDDILSEEYLRPIACAYQKDSLKAWLVENNIPFITARSGWPRVHRKALEKIMGVQAHQTQDSKVEFNFDAIK